MYTLWFVFICEPQWFVAEALHFRPALKIPTAIVVTLTLSLFFVRRRADWLTGVLAWVAISVINLPFTFDRGLAFVPLKQLIFFYLLGLCLLRVVDSPRRAAPILTWLFVGQYLWWAAWGLKDASIWWHPNLDNFDSYGPLMAVGIGPAYYYGMAADSLKRRRVGFIAAAICVLAVVDTFARGAVLSVVVTVGYIWLRSPRKGRTTIFVLSAGLVVAIAGSLIDGTTRGDDTRANFWDEMASSFDPSDGTGQDRKVLWSLAVKVFKQRPLLGAGADNFGAAAAEMFRANVPGFRIGEVGGSYAENPARLYQRALHNSYYQILSEFGLAGVAVFVTLLVGLGKDLRMLQSQEAAAAWRKAGGEGDVGSLARGLEAGMVAFLSTAYFYNQLFTPIFFSMLFAGVLLASLVRERMSADSPQRRPRGLGRAAPSLEEFSIATSGVRNATRPLIP